jgi:outer membrane protein assembly factor BamB
MVFAILAVLLFNILLSGLYVRSVKADSQKTSSQTANVVLESRLNGQASITNETVHNDPSSVILVIPSNAAQDSAAIALYPYNKSLNSLTSFSVWVSFTTAVPRFVIYLDTNNDGLTDVILLSDYQIVSNGQWEMCTGGIRWGWTQSNTQLSNYGQTWNQLDYWKNQYANSTVLYVGIALEYWAVHDQGGINQPLYADELILNGLTYNLTSAPSQLPSANIDYWTMYRHDLQRSGVSASPAVDCDLIWQFFTGPSAVPSLADRLRASPTVAGGVVYIGSNGSYFYALNATNGSPIWQVNVGSNVESSAAVANGIVYVGILWDGHNGYVDALNATNGATVWRFATNSGIESSPAVVNGVVYIGSFYGYVYALNATDGTLIWSYLTGGSTFSSPAVVGGVVYIGSIDGKVYALNASTGTLSWFFHAGDPIYSSPAVANNVIYIASDNGTVFALNASNGLEIWQVSIGKGDHADDSPAVANGVVYVGSRNGYYAFNATNGSQIWFFTSPYSPRQFTGYVYSSPAVAGNVVYFGSFDSYVFALDATNGSMVWSYRTGGFLFSSPAVVNGVLYIGSYDGNVYALGTISAPSSTPAPAPTQQAVTSSTPPPTVKPVSDSTPQPSASPPIVLSAPAPTQLPNQDPPKSNQSPAGPILAVEPSQNGSADWLILGAIIFAGALALVSLVVIFKKGA